MVEIIEGNLISLLELCKVIFLLALFVVVINFLSLSRSIQSLFRAHIAEWSHLVHINFQVRDVRQTAAGIVYEGAAVQVQLRPKFRALCDWLRRG